MRTLPPSVARGIAQGAARRERRGADRQSPNPTIDDATITSKVKAKFVADSVVDAMDVNVNTFAGVVQLAGFADSPEQARRAERIAAETAGVKSVLNDIRIARK